MKRLILLLFSGMAFAQTFTVSGHVVNPNTGVPTGTQITFKLINTGTQQCKVSGTGLIVPNNQVFTPDGTGTISGTLYRNDFIVCGGASNTQWSYVITAPGVTMPTCALAAVTTTSLNVDSAACTNTVPVVTPPTGDTSYCRLDGSNCGFTGNVTFNSHNISGINSATAAQGILNPTANNVDVLASTRFTDSSPTGNFLNFKSVAAATLFKVDIAGNLTAASIPSPGVIGGTTPAAATFTTVNKVIYVDQQAGATADVKFANACTALPAGGGTLDASGFGSGNQTIAATVSCGSQSQPVRFKFDPSTVFQPSSASVNMFQVNYNNVFDGLLHIDTSNQTFTGNAIQLPPTTSASRAWVRAWVVMSSAATGPCFTFTSTGSNGVAFSDFDITCTNVGTAASAFLVSAGGTTFFNGNHIKLTVNNTVSTAPKYCVNLLVTASGAGIGGNEFNIHCEMNTLSTALAGVHLNTAAAGNALDANRFQLDAYDIQGTNQAVIVDAGNVCQNVFWGLLANGSGTAVTDNTTCGLGNEYHDLVFGTIQRIGLTSAATYNGTITLGTVASGDAGVLNMFGAIFFNQEGNPSGVAGKDTIYGDSTGIKQNVNNAFGGTNAFGLLVWAPCVTLQKAETGADANVLTCAVPGGSAGPGTYRISIVISVSAANTATLGWTATWTDSNGNAQTPTNLALYQSGTAAPALTFATSAAGNYYADALIDVNNGGANVVIKTTFSGTSVAEKVSATVERVQ